MTSVLGVRERIKTTRNVGYIRSRCNMEKTNRAHAIETILECGKSGGLREKHQKAIKTLVQMWVFVRFKELKSEIWSAVSEFPKSTVEKGEVQVNTGDSRSWTSLSI